MIDVNKIVKKIGLLHSVSAETPIDFPLAQEIVNQLAIDYTDPDLKFLDPACGRGTILIALLERLEQYHSRKHIVENMLYGVDISTVQSSIARKALKLLSNCEPNVYTNNFFDLDFEHKFDAVLSSLPFNSNDTARNYTSHRGQGENLAKKFAFKIIDISRADAQIALVMPYGHRTYSPKTAKYFVNNGLYLIDTTNEYFKTVSTNPCVFYFDRTQTVNAVEDRYKSHNRPVPKQNIGQIFKNQPGRLNRKDYEHLLKDNGQYKIIITTMVTKYTDDKSIVDNMMDSTRGKWRVVFNCTTSKGVFGKIIVADPNSYLSKSVHCLVVENKEQAFRLKEYLETDSVKEILKQVKLNACNSKKFLKYISLPKSLDTVKQ